MSTLFYLFAKIIDVDADSVGIPKAAASQEQVTSIFNGVMMLAGAVAVVFIVLGGIRYSISQGLPADTKKAKETIIYALVGLVFVIISFAVVQVFTMSVF